MADLNVQPKKRASVWPWLLLVLIITAAAYFLFRDKNEVAEGTVTDSTNQHSTDTVNQYRSDTVNQYHTDTLRTDTTSR
ncbi:MAG TPA: hypothetical protein VM101_16915 [Flavitalea sp.]|nr:hypothetical protein [Flavitalea sp.]